MQIDRIEKQTDSTLYWLNSTLLVIMASFFSSWVHAAAPTAPVIGPAWYERSGAVVTFKPPVSDGGSSISGYTVTANPGGKTATGTVSPITVPGLTNGTFYTFSVVAANKDGDSGPSASSGNVMARPFAPVSGLINNLVVFVRFSDQPSYALPLSYYTDLFNFSVKSLKNFYLENSYGALTVNSLFPTPDPSSLSPDGYSYQDPHPTAYYQQYDATMNPIGYRSSAEGTQRETDLVANALHAVKDQIAPDVILDGDSDGYIDHITFEVYSSTPNPQPVKFYSRATFDTSDSLILNGKKVGSYTWVAASQDSPSYYLASVEIHEMGHSFGYPDLRGNSGRTPVGDWDVMSMSKPVHSGAYMKHRFTGWIPSVPEIAAYGTYSLNDITQGTNNSYKIKLANTSEFLVLEYRRNTGPFEYYLPGSGLCITRVNESAGIWGNLGGPPFFLYYFRPGGTFSNDGSSSNSFSCLNAETGRVQFNDYSNPPCFLSDGSPCGISIENIGVSSGSAISFDIADPATVVVKRVISGYFSSGGSRVGGATVTLSGDAYGTVTTDNLGKYVFVVNEGGNYTVTPTKVNWTFSPDAVSYSPILSDQIQNYVGSKITHTISGTVTSAAASLSNVQVVINCPSGGNYTGPLKTDSSGFYSFVVDAGSSCTVWPNYAGHTFYPNQQKVTAIANNVTQDFSEVYPVLLTGSISFNGTALAGISVASPGAMVSPVLTDVGGAYTFTVSAGNASSYVVTPSSQLYTFSPVSRTYQGLLGAQTNQDYSASPIALVSNKPYGTLLSAYTAAIADGGATVQLRDAASVVYTEVLVFDQAVGVVLEGGYDSAYQDGSGYSEIHGVVKIYNGKVTVNRIKIR